MNKRIWKDIVGYEGLYIISNDGIVRSLDRKVKNRFGYWTRKGVEIGYILDKRGYPRTWLYKDSKQTHPRIHRLVATTFIPNPENKYTVNHKNGIKTDNRVENLEWMTGEENTAHAFTNGIRKNKSGSEAHNAKLSDRDVRHIKMGLMFGVRVGQLAEIFEVAGHTISAVRTGKRSPEVSLNILVDSCDSCN